MINYVVNVSGYLMKMAQNITQIENATAQICEGLVGGFQSKGIDIILISKFYLFRII